MGLFNIGGSKDEPPRGKGKETSIKRTGREKKEDDFAGITPIGKDNISIEEDENAPSEIEEETGTEEETNTEENDIEETDTEETNKEEDTMEDDNPDYIDPDEINYTDYEDIVDTIESNDWTRVSSSGLCPITHHDHKFVFSKLVQKDFRESVVEVKCPEGRIIAVCGFNHGDIDRERFLDSPNLYSRPHFINLRCADYNNSEISPMTVISIIKAKNNGEVEQLYQELYGDLSPMSDGRLKKKGERYYLAETVVLQKGEKLIFQVLGPDRDISKIDFFMMADVFVKDD